MSMPSSSITPKTLKKLLRKALVRYQKEHPDAEMTFGQMAAAVNDDLASFKDYFRSTISKGSVKDFRDDVIPEEKKAQAAPAPNFSQANDRARRLKIIPPSVCFAWLGALPASGLYIITRDRSVYYAWAAQCDRLAEQPDGLTDDSLVYLLTKDSGTLSVAKDQPYRYGDVASYKTPDEIKAQGARDSARDLERQRRDAYKARTAIWRNPETCALMYREAAITFLGAGVSVVGDGRVFAGDDAANQLYFGPYPGDAPLAIPVDEVYERVAAMNTFRVVNPGYPLHKRNHATYDRATRIEDVEYYTRVLYERFRQSGGIEAFVGRKLIIRLTDYLVGRRHMTALAPPSGNIQDFVRQALRAAVQAGTSPGASLELALDGRWHVTIERNSQSGENINAYPDGRVVNQYGATGDTFLESLGDPDAATIIGADGDLLTETSLNQRFRW